MLKTWTVEPNTLELLKKLQSIPELTNTWLFGGAALSFHLGHRIPNDLDLFGNFNHDIITEVLKSLSFDDFCVVMERMFRKHYLINNVKVDILKFESYQLLEKTIVEDNIRLIGLKDLSANKIDAITNRYDALDRRSKKDFVDLFFLLKVFNINEILGFYQTKFPDTNVMSVIESLTIFEEVEKEDMPKMIIQTSWKEVKKRIFEMKSEIGV